MQRENRKYVLLAVLAYLVIMVAAYRWSLQQIPTDGPLLTHIEREEVRKMKERQAAEAIAKAQAGPATAEARMSSAGVAYVAARYDVTHVVFVVSSESRFSPIRSSVLAGTPTRLPAPEKTYASLAGMQELWEPDPNSLRFFPKLFQTTKAGDSWTLSLSSTLTIPVFIERPINHCADRVFARHRISGVGAYRSAIGVRRIAARVFRSSAESCGLGRSCGQRTDRRTSSVEGIARTHSPD
jgi:hypothetical protein